MKAGAMMKKPAITRKAIGSLHEAPALTSIAAVGSATRSMSRAPAEEAGRPDEKDDRHDHEDHRVRGLGEEDLGEAFDDPEREAGDDRAHDRAHAADHDDGEHHDDEVRAHQRAHIVD